MIDNPNRDLGASRRLPQRSGRQRRLGAAPLIALAIIALIVGGLFWFAPSNDQVATNTPAERSAPAPKAPVTPAPPTTAPTAPQK